MSHTTDDDKKPVDNQAKREKKNELRERNREAGKFQYSKRPTIYNHLSGTAISSSFFIFRAMKKSVTILKTYSHFSRK